MQVNQYDKIFRENLEAVIPSLMQKVLGIVAVHSEELPDDIQHTKERKPDVLKKITDKHGSTFVLHIEFQVLNEKDMAYRMAEYHIMLSRKYRLPVEQFVIYLGASKGSMPTKISTKQMKYEYTLVRFLDLDYELFLKSSKPEEVVLGVLANHRGEEVENVLKQIVQRIDETSEGGLSFERYINQLRILAQLRKLEKNLTQIAMLSISKHIDMRRDPFYKIGQEEQQTKFVLSLLQKTDYTHDQIADLAGVSVEFVRQTATKH